MKLIQLKKNFQNILLELYSSEEIQSLFNILSERHLNLSRIEIALNPEKEVSEVSAEKFKSALIRLQNHEPIQYIIGETEFYGLPFKVNEHTLIPRPETEELVAWILSDMPAFELIDVLDIGTGSGCIAISIAKNLPQAIVSAVDISEDALFMAKKNALINEVEVNFFQMDVLGIQMLPMKYDVIASNPPYVRELEKKLMHQNVLKYEPTTALFVRDEDALEFYRAISLLAKAQLKPDGKLFFEINEYLAEEMFTLLKGEGFQNIELKKDIFGKDRMIKCTI